MAPKLPLGGIRVLDFGWQAAGPLCARMLAWGGAEVIRIESMVHHDRFRMSPPTVPGHEGSVNVSGPSNNLATNKLSVSINIQHPKGKEMVLRLAEKSDVVVENYSTGVMDRLGLGYEVLKQRNPSIIMVSHTLMGQNGPWERVAGHGPSVAGPAGWTGLSGYPDRDPIAPTGAFMDFNINPHHSSYAVLAALYHRRKTGEGQHIDLSQYESIIGATGTAVLEYTALGHVRQRDGYRSPYAAPQGVYPCAPLVVGNRSDERWVAISVATDAEWRTLCQIMDQPSLANDPRFATFDARKQHEDAIDPIIAAWTVDKVAEAVEVRLQSSGVAAGVVETAKDLLTVDPQLAHRGHYRKTTHAEAGERINDGPPFIMSATPIAIRAAPMLGQHNDYVFKQLLGMSEDEINEGYADGSIQ
jgi:crotonobetainyl-CoA:carnitine CoA-transferase CaiB-like acyl-CoA transferase